jgi:hypothetical protein
MPSKPIVCVNALPGTKLCKADNSRLLISIFLPLGQVPVYLSDNPDDQNFYYLQPGEMIVLSVFDGDRVSREWFARSSGVDATVLVHEEYSGGTN